MTPAQAEHDNQQPVGDDTCGERCVAMALELSGAFIGPAAGKGFVDEAWQAIVDADAPGTPESQRGSTLAEEGRVIDLGASVFNLGVTRSPVDSGAQLLAAVRLGLYVVAGVYLGDLLPGMTSNHFILAYATDPAGLNVTFVDPAHDIDGAWWISHDLYPLATVERGGYDLFGQGQQFGWAFRYTKGAPTVDEDQQQAEIDMEARQGQLLTDAIRAIRTGQWKDLDTLYCALKGGLPAPDYTPSWP